jgi:hypothetical protein
MEAGGVMRIGSGWYYRTLRRFDQGIIDSGLISGRGESPLALLDAENIRLHTGSPKPRTGQKYLDKDIYVSQNLSDINGLYQYARQYTMVGGSIGTYTAYVWAQGTKLYLWDGVGDPTIWDITAGLEINLKSDDIYCVTYLDYMYITNGHEIIKTDGTADGTTLLSSTLDLAAPAINMGIVPAIGAGNLSGKRDYRYRYVKKVGGSVVAKSAFWNIQTIADLVNQNVNLSYLASADPDVTHVEIWATKTYTVTAPTQYYRIITNINATDTSLDMVSDLVIGSYYSEEIGSNNIGTISGLNKMVFYLDRLFGIPEGEDASLVRYSKIGLPEVWEADSWIDVKRDDGDYVTTIARLGSSLYFFKNRSIWSLSGDPDAIPLIQVRSGTDATSNQTEVGVGCTAPRSMCSTSNGLIFYSKYKGVCKLTQDGYVNLSSNIASKIKGLSNPSGVVYNDSNGHEYYVLATQDSIGTAWVCDLETGSWVKDINIHAPSFLIDSDGYVLAGTNRRINRFYHPDYDTDNDVQIEAMIRTHWYDLQEAEKVALMRELDIGAKDASGFFTVQVFNQNEQQPVDNFIIDSNDAVSDFSPDVYARLLSLKLRWTIGEIETLIPRYMKRKQRQF